MDEETKKTLKKLTQDTEARFARSILRWKYKRDGRAIPVDRQLDELSRDVADQAHQVIVSSSRNIWRELKKAYSEENKSGKDEETPE
jgi:hypothetical protein